MSSKQSLDRDEVHIIPFNSKYFGPIEVEYCDLSAEKSLIRGVNVVKRNITTDIRIFENQKEIKGTVFYWRIDSVCCEDKFIKGLELMEKGLGFNPATKSITSFLKK